MIRTKKAILKGNNVYCPKCDISKYQLTDDYKVVKVQDIKYIEFVARCLNCGEKFYFQSKITMSSTTHYNFSINEEVVIKDE